MLVKLTPGVHFINIIRTAFTLVDPKSVKKIDNLNVFPTLLGSGCVKAVHRKLMKFSPGVNFTCFTHSFSAPRSQKHKKLSHQYLLTLLGSASAKAVRRTLMKFSPGVNFTCFTHSFYAPRSQKHKNTAKSSVSSYAFGICECKSCTSSTLFGNPKLWSLSLLSGVCCQSRINIGSDGT